MVERTEAKPFTEFEGKVISVKKVATGKVKNPSGSDKAQYELEMHTDATKTKRMMCWVPIPETATGESVPVGSIIEQFIKAIERLEPALKKTAKVEDVFQWMNGKEFLFSREKLGKAFKGYEAADYWVPIKLL